MNPDVVLAAFMPETELELTLEGTLVLEALGCAFVTGGRAPGLRDAMLALLVMTDLEEVKRARKRGDVDGLLERAGRGVPPRELLARVPQIAEAVRAATAPAAGLEPGGETGVEKKRGRAAAGG